MTLTALFEVKPPPSVRVKVTSDQAPTRVPVLTPVNLAVAWPATASATVTATLPCGTTTGLLVVHVQPYEGEPVPESGSRVSAAIVARPFEVWIWSSLSAGLLRFSTGRAAQSHRVSQRPDETSWHARATRTVNDAAED